MFVLRSQPKGARFASFGLGLCVFALMPTEIGYQDIASLLARQPGVAERWQKRVFSSAGTIQVATFCFRPSDRNLLAANRDLSPGEPRQSGHRHHGFRDAQSARRSAAALSRRRFSQGRSHAERRSPRRDAAACGNRNPGRARAGDRGSRDIEHIGQGRQDRRDGAVRRARAARSRAAGRAERAAAGAIRHVAVARNQASGRSQDCSGNARGRARACAAARWLLLQDLEPVLWFVARLAREHRALAARRRAGHRDAGR